MACLGVVGEDVPGYDESRCYGAPPFVDFSDEKIGKRIVIAREQRKQWDLKYDTNTNKISNFE